MNLFAMLLAILAGIFTTIEASINSQLGKYLTPSIATLHSLIVGLTFMFFINLFLGNLPRYAKVTSVNPIWLIGGFFGAFIIYLSSKSIPRLGISSTLILILAGQLVSGLLIDALVNNAEISFKKMMGMIMFLAGAVIFLQE
ncbi:DMT family transporter [Anaerocolumna sp. AGMB13025]|uniref:DMT family transporter n=1 Tax=Anaerocolumna sp. AGMB13025 TaxID=3039116 RepID=UPI00241EA8E7|nr:DMT family transporter [Anaerocolumna sp. AGMB13025]WFR56551.1 DMT family transporter [Anaerocolumna sp. AGMB13025]